MRRTFLAVLAALAALAPAPAPAEPAAADEQRLWALARFPHGDRKTTLMWDEKSGWLCANVTSGTRTDHGCARRGPTSIDRTTWTARFKGTLPSTVRHDGRLAPLGSSFIRYDVTLTMERIIVVPVTAEHKLPVPNVRAAVEVQRHAVATGTMLSARLCAYSSPRPPAGCSRGFVDETTRVWPTLFLELHDVRASA